MKRSVLYIVVPCFNEEECIEETAKRLGAKISELAKKGLVSAQKSRMVFVDDGSRDKTWEKISGLSKKRRASVKVIGVRLAHNRGHQNALLAGILYAKEREADAIISIDADLQDNVEAIDEMVRKFREGYEVVYGVRKERRTDSFAKRGAAQGFYRVMRALGAEVIYNAGDFRLMSRRAVEALSEYGEVNLFLRGIVPEIGFRSTTVSYARAERFAGKSKFTARKMLHFAWDGITSFSTRPIRMVLGAGVVIFIASFLIMVYAVGAYLLGKTVPGWTFIICSIWLLGGIQMVSLGLVGEYIGKIYAESKRRPRYFIEEIVGE